MNNKAVVTSTIGYMCLASLGWMLSMPDAGWFDKLYGHGFAMMLPLALMLGTMGILAFTNDNALDAITFFGGAGYFWCEHSYDVALISARAADSNRYHGWYLFVWAVFYGYVWLGSFGAGIQRWLFLLGFWLTLLTFAIGEWCGVHSLAVLGGYLGLVTSIMAAVTSASAVMHHGPPKICSQ